MNDAMSFGIHRLWKDTYISGLNPRGGIKCLDVAGGTGEIEAMSVAFPTMTQNSLSCVNQATLPFAS